MKNEDSDEDGGGGSGDGAEVCANFETGEQTKKNDDGKRGDESGEPPMSKRVVTLIPGHRRTS